MYLAHAARRRMSLPNASHFRVILQLLTVVCMALTSALIIRLAVINASTAPNAQAKGSSASPCTRLGQGAGVSLVSA
jgi:hypothetical protein